MLVYNRWNISSWYDKILKPLYNVAVRWQEPMLSMLSLQALRFWKYMDSHIVR